MGGVGRPGGDEEAQEMAEGQMVTQSDAGRCWGGLSRGGGGARGRVWGCPRQVTIALQHCCELWSQSSGEAASVTMQGRGL